jgi:hypothetical protein
MTSGEYAWFLLLAWQMAYLTTLGAVSLLDRRRSKRIERELYDEVMRSKWQRESEEMAPRRATPADELDTALFLAGDVRGRELWLSIPAHEDFLRWSRSVLGETHAASYQGVPVTPCYGQVERVRVLQWTPQRREAQA